MKDSTYDSDEILNMDDLYALQDTPFSYRLTDDEMGWVDFVRGRYSIVDWVDANRDGRILTFDNTLSMSIALDADCDGAGKATMLSDDTALQKLFFWLYIEDTDNE